MEIGTIYGASLSALLFVLAVVAITDDDLAKRLYIFSEKSLATMIFKTNKSGAIIALYDHIADHSAIAGDSVGVYKRNAPELRSLMRPIIMAQQLVAAADSEKDSFLIGSVA